MNELEEKEDAEESDDDINLHLNESSKIQGSDVLKRNTKNRKLTKAQLDPNNWSTNFILPYRGNPLTLNNLFKKTKEEKEEIAKFVFDFYKTKGFPYPTYSDSVLKKDWKNLCDLYIKNVSDGSSDVLSSFFTQGTKIFKHFDPHFWEARDKGSRSSVDIFNDDESLMEIIRNRLGITFYYRGVSYPFDVTGNQIRQGMRSMRKTAHVTNFRASIAKFLYDTYCNNGDIVYDYSSGFNQRMLGAKSLSDKNIHYVGVDPWNKTIEAGRNIIKFFGFENVSLNQSGSEDFCPDKLKGSVSFAFSSPPYFDKEIYCSDESQAYNNKSYEDFLNGYWKKTVDNIFQLLKKENGIFGLNISERQRKENIKDDMVRIVIDKGFKFVKEYKMVLTRSHLSGKVGKDIDDLKKLEPIVIFHKK